MEAALTTAIRILKYSELLLPAHMDLITLIEKLPFLTNEQRQDIIDKFPEWNQKQQFAFRNAVLATYKKMAASQKKTLEALENFQHKTLTPLFQKKEKEDRQTENQKLDTIIKEI